MGTYVLMRVLESAPSRYERGMRWLTLGRIDRAYDRLVEPIRSGDRVLDVGCGPGPLTLRAARRGARVKAIDIAPAMLEIAAARLRSEGLADRVELVEMGVAELDRESDESFDVVTSGLCLSELSPDEVRYTLAAAARILRPGGLLLVADEIRPASGAARWLHGLVRAWLVALTWIVTQQSTHPVEGLEARVIAAGFEIVSRRADGLGSFVELVARRPRRAAS